MKARHLTILLALAIGGLAIGLSAASQADPNGVRPDAAHSVPGTKWLIGKYSIQRIASFSDPLAYGGERGFYVVRDDESGREWIGVSGVGISELGVHQEGSDKNKHDVGDDR